MGKKSNKVNRYINNLLSLATLFRCRLRPIIFAIRGANMSHKVGIERGCRMMMPWCFSLGDRVVIEENVFLKAVQSNAQVLIGDHVFLGRGVEIDALKKVEIGSHTLIAPGCFITDHNHGIAVNLRIDQQVCVQADVIIRK